MVVVAMVSGGSGVPLRILATSTSSGRSPTACPPMNSAALLPLSLLGCQSLQVR